ncbi:hypothetical protein Bca52824_045554 [Brassica carinata]|uniref:glutathione transferase n=3 Tax=Brassica TaxID=3705 RepID=A0A8X7RCR1_BRACI|nr:hypothetical protein Bca52824_045554 [Brassica carinata]
MATKEEDVKLLGFWASPFSRRVEIALKLKGVTYEYLEQDIFNKSALLLELNPVFKKVPVLVHKGKILAESHLILEYIDQTWKNNPILPRDPYEKAMARFWAKFVDEQVGPVCFKSVVKADKGIDVAIEEAQELITFLEKELIGKDFFGGKTIGFLDMVAGSMIPFCVAQAWEGMEIDMIPEEKFPELNRWIKNLNGIEIVRECIPNREKQIDHMMKPFRSNPNLARKSPTLTMGEYKIEDFSKPITPVGGAKTGVFWNVEDCPFPVGFSPDMIYHKIESALSEWCNVGNMSMWAYVDEEKGHWSGKGEFLRNWTFVFWLTDDYPVPVGVGIHSIHSTINAALHQMGFDKVQPIQEYCDNDKRYNVTASKQMVREMLVRAGSMYGEPVNLVVIAKQSTNPEMNRVLHCLNSRNNPVLVVEPPDDDTARDSVFRSVYSLVECTHVVGNWTFVFWLTDDYPVPVGVGIHSIHSTINAALHQMGFDKVQPIQEYCDNDKRYNVTASKQMVREMLVRAGSMYGEPVNLVVIAKQSTNPEMNRVLHCLNSRNNPVLVVEPPDDDTARDSVFRSVYSLVECTHVVGGGKTTRPQSCCYDIVFGDDSGSGSDTDTDIEEDAYRWRKRMIYKLEG